MKKIVQIHIYKGDKYYIAEGVDLPIVTQAMTLDELVKNIQEAVELQLEGENPSDYNLVADPSVLLNFELPSQLHA